MALDPSYVQVLLQGSEREEIIQLLVLAGINLPKYDFHCTLMYDERDLEGPLCTLPSYKEYEATVQSVEVLGDALVFHLISPGLVDEHTRLKQKGYQSSYGVYLPHMSITYDFDKYDMIKANTLFADWGGRKLTFSEEQFGED